MKRLWWIAIGALCLGMLTRVQADELKNLGPEEFVQASGVDIDVPGYSVPSFVDWNNDGLNDLIIGDGPAGSLGKVHIYLNVGTWYEPDFSSDPNNYFYAQHDDYSDLSVPGDGCLGAFPRVVYWDADSRKDLLVSRSDGKVEIFLNTNTDIEPLFDSGTLLQVGDPTKTDIDVGDRATATVVDWNNDLKKDLVIGAYDGLIRIFINEGTDTEPDFHQVRYAQNSGVNLDVPASRSSPDVLDLDGDSKKDILTGNTNGQLLLYSNTGSDADPNFSDYTSVESDGNPIDLSSSRSRPFVCYWTSDGLPDVLIGASDGKVHLYQGVPEVADLNCDGEINSLDIDPFVQVLTSSSPYDDYYTAYPYCDAMLADCNDDGSINSLDIDPFVGLLTGS